MFLEWSISQFLPLAQHTPPDLLHCFSDPTSGPCRTDQWVSAPLFGLTLWWLSWGSAEVVWHPGPRLHFRNRSCPKVFDMDVIVAPAPLPNPYTHTMCAKKPFFILLKESSIHVLMLITLGCTSIKVDETCNMHLSDKSVWRALLSLPRGHCAASERTQVWPWCCHGPPACPWARRWAIMALSVPSSVKWSLRSLFRWMIFYSFPWDSLLLLEGYLIHLWLTLSEHLIYNRHCSECFTCLNSCKPLSNPVRVGTY